MTETKLRRRGGEARETFTVRIQHTALWRVKVRLQFSGWLQYVSTAMAGTMLCILGALLWLGGGLLGVRQPLLFWIPGTLGLLLVALALFDVVTIKFGVRPPESLPARFDGLDAFELMIARRSCRSFQRRNLTEEDRNALLAAAREQVRSECLIGTRRIRFEYVAAPLTVWPAVGAHEFLVAITPWEYDRLAVIDVGRSLQKVVLEATRRGVATCWIGPGAEQSSIARTLGERFDPREDHVICVCALGYRSRFIPLAVRLMTLSMHRRLPLGSLFFADPDYREPLDVDALPYSSFGRCYEVCQWSPSSYNGQPTRCAVVTDASGSAVARADFAASTESRYYAPVALGIWCANWEAGCAALGIPGHFEIVGARDRGVVDAPDQLHYDLSWVSEASVG